MESKFLEVSIPKLESVSDRYRFISTAEFVKDVEVHGFKLLSVLGRSKTGHGKHLLTFDRPDLVLPNGDKIQLLVYNAHDGSSAFKLFLGYYRLVCSNGLMVGTPLESVSIRHVGYAAAKVASAVTSVLGKVDALKQTIAAMEAYNMKPEAQLGLARQALDLRSCGSAEPLEVLFSRRLADRGTSLWQTFNTVQENVQRGDYYIIGADGQRRLARALTGAASRVNFNRKLWNIAVRYLTVRGE